MPVVANVKRRHSSAILSYISRAHIGAPATTTRCLVGRLRSATGILRSCTSTMLRAVSAHVRQRGAQLGQVMRHVPVRAQVELGRRRCHRRQVVGRLRMNLRSHLAGRARYLGVVRAQLNVISRHHLMGRGRQLRLLRRRLGTTSPRGLLGEKCDVALGGNGTIVSTSMLRPNSRLAAHFTGKRVGDVMAGGWGRM